jgi:hypothetical protein
MACVPNVPPGRFEMGRNRHRWESVALGRGWPLVSQTCRWRSERGRDPSGHLGAPLAALDRLAGDPRCDVVRVVLGLGLERQKPPQFTLDLRTVGPCGPEHGERFVMVVAGRSLTEPCPRRRPPR